METSIEQVMADFKKLQGLNEQDALTVERHNNFCGNDTYHVLFRYWMSNGTVLDVNGFGKLLLNSNNSNATRELSNAESKAIEAYRSAVEASGKTMLN